MQKINIICRTVCLDYADRLLHSQYSHIKHFKRENKLFTLIMSYDREVTKTEAETKKVYKRCFDIISRNGIQVNLWTQI